MCSANAINTVLLCGGLKEKRKTEVTQKLLLLEVRKTSVSTEKKQKIPTPTPPAQPEKLTLSKKQYTTDRKAALK